MGEIYNVLNEQISELVSQKLFYLEEARKIDLFIDRMKGVKGHNRFEGKIPYNPPISRIVSFEEANDRDRESGYKDIIMSKVYKYLEQ